MTSLDFHFFGDQGFLTVLTFSWIVLSTGVPTQELEWEKMKFPTTFRPPKIVFVQETRDFFEATS